MNTSERLQEVVKFFGISVNALATQCGLKQPTLDKHIKGIAEPSVATLSAIANTFPEISSDWLLCGRGEMLVSDNPTQELARIEKLTNVVESLQEMIDIKNKKIKDLERQLSILSQNH